MRKLLAALLLCSASAFGQSANPSIVLVTAVPTGTCGAGLPDEQVLATGALYSCQSVVAGVGTWGLGAAPAGVPQALPFGSTAVTNPFSGDTSTDISTDQFVGNAINFSQSRFAMNIVGGTYSFDSQGSGGQVVIFVTGGSVSSVLTIANPGSGYAVGDLLFIPAGGAVGGNSDAIVRVTTISGSGIASASVIYGGTGYTATGLGSTVNAASGRPFTFIWVGAVTSPVQIIMKFGTYLTTSNQWIMANNTTGASGALINVCEGNASDMCGGGSTVNLAQGTANSRQVMIETDGELNMFLAAIQNPADLAFTAAAASNCNQSGVLTAVTSCMPVTVSGVIHYVPVF